MCQGKSLLNATFAMRQKGLVEFHRMARGAGFIAGRTEPLINGHHLEGGPFWSPFSFRELASHREFERPNRPFSGTILPSGHGLFQHPVEARPANPEPRPDLRSPELLLILKTTHLVRLDRRRATFVGALVLGLPASISWMRRMVPSGVRAGGWFPVRQTRSACQKRAAHSVVSESSSDPIASNDSSKSGSGAVSSVKCQRPIKQFQSLRQSVTSHAVEARQSTQIEVISG